MQSSVLKQLGVSELQVFGLAVLRGQYLCRSLEGRVYTSFLLAC